METAESIYAEGVNNNQNEMQAIAHDDDIVTEINQTVGYEQIASVEMVGKEHKAENRVDHPLYSVDKVEKYRENKSVIIVAAVAIIYSVIVSTVALIMALHNSPTSSVSPNTLSSCDCTLNNMAAKSDQTVFCTIIDFCLDEPSVIPSISPTNTISHNPSLSPTIIPTNSPTIEPTILPTLEPTMEPTLHPTDQPTRFNGYFIGDFKLSLKSEDHSFWRLCNGKGYRIDGEYSLLFEEIGFMFGSYNVTQSNVTYQYFRIPNVSDSVVGIAGNDHALGEHIGEEGVVLTNNNIPAHTHKVIAWAQSTDGTSNYPDRSICQSGFQTAYNLNHCPLANGWATGYQWQYGNTPVSVMQPTAFISNLFIYTGVSL